MNSAETDNSSLVIDEPELANSDRNDLGSVSGHHGIETTSDLVGTTECWTKAKPLGLEWEIDPLIVLPGYGKAFDVRSLADFWSLPTSPGGCMNTKGDVFVIGLGLAHDDFIINALFRDTIRHIEDDRQVVVINPDSKALTTPFFSSAQTCSC